MAKSNNRAKVRSGHKVSANSGPATKLGQWPDGSELFRKRYKYEIKTTFSEAELQRTERILEVRLPKSYVRLLRERNGGSLRYNSILLKRAPKTFPMSGRVYSFGSIAGIHRSHSDGLTQRAQIAGEWGVPKGMIALDGDGHWWLCLDYRKCGPGGEPTVVHWEQWSPRTDKSDTFKVADTFEHLITHLQFDTGSYLFALDGSGVDENGLADKLKKLGCTKLPGSHPHWKWRQFHDNIHCKNPLEMFVTDNGEIDPWHLARPARHRLLYVPVRKEDSRQCITQLAEALGDDAELIHQPIDYRHIRL